MAKIQETRSYSGKSAGDGYQAVLKAVPAAGFEIWKRRDIAWLVMVRCGSEKEAIDGNVSVRPGAHVTVSLNSIGLNEVDLKAQAEKIFGEVSKVL